MSVRPLGPGIYRGLLTNAGVSSVITDEGERHPILRPPDAQPISEFSLEDHMQVFGLPDETLYSFEGSGVETGWNLAFPETANPNGLQNLLDVSIEFNAWAYYSPEKHEADLQAPAPAFYSMLVVSAAHWWPAELAKVQGNTSPVVLAFDLAKLPFPAVEAGRTLSNLFVVLGGAEALTGPATMAAASPPTQVQIAFAEGIALSNSPPLTDPAEPPNPQPLDQLVGIVLPPGPSTRGTFQTSISPGCRTSFWASSTGRRRRRPSRRRREPSWRRCTRRSPLPAGGQATRRA